VQSFLSTLRLQPNDGHHEREPAQRHELCRAVSLREAMDQLLIPFRLIAPEDTQELTGLLLQLAHAIEQNPAETCTIYKMSPNYSRERGIDDRGRVKNLFQGAAPVNPPDRRGSVYPGDREIHEPNSVTIQIHVLSLTQDNQDVIVARDVPVVAVWVPSRMAIPWIVQNQPATGQVV
jgi:hypothetical protein